MEMINEMLNETENSSDADWQRQFLLSSQNVTKARTN